MLFNADPSKQAIEICFSQKRDKENFQVMNKMFK